MLKAIEYKTLKEYQEANLKAHKICSKLEGYNSKMYANEKGILTIKKTYLLILLPQFEKQLLKAGLKFKEFERNYIYKPKEEL